MENRITNIVRTTKETDINLTLNLDGTGKTNIHTGVGFFDHMLNSFAVHGKFDIKIKKNEAFTSKNLIFLIFEIYPEKQIAVYKPSPAGKGDHEVVDEEVALSRVSRLL